MTVPASSVTYQQNFSGSKLRTALSRFTDKLYFSDAVGADPTGQTYNDTAFANICKAIAVNAQAYTKGGPRIEIPPGRYRFKQRPSIKYAPVYLKGLGTVSATGYGSSVEFWFDDGVAGPIVHGPFTTDTGTETTSSGNAEGTIFENIAFIGGHALASNKPSSGLHGIQARTRIHLRNVVITGFDGDGLHAVGSTDQQGLLYGGLNGMDADVVYIRGVQGNGVYVAGSDSNTGTYRKIDVAGCGLTGINDQSFIGCHWVAPEVANTGWCGQCWYNGVRYYCIDSARGGAVQPGTDITVWVPLENTPSPANNMPEWVAGNYYSVGLSYDFGLYTPSNLDGAYKEDDCGPPRVYSATRVNGGNIASKGFAAGSNPNYSGGDTEAGVKSGFKVMSPSGGSDLSIDIGRTPDTFMSMASKQDSGYGHQWRWDDLRKHLMLQLDRLDAKVPVRFTTDIPHDPSIEPLRFGRANPPEGGHIALTNGVFVGISDNSRYIGAGYSPPTSGPYAVGDRWLNVDPFHGANQGIDLWICQDNSDPNNLVWHSRSI